MKLYGLDLSASITQSRTRLPAPSPTRPISDPQKIQSLLKDTYSSFESAALHCRQLNIPFNQTYLSFAIAFLTKVIHDGSYNLEGLKKQIESADFCFICNTDKIPKQYQAYYDNTTIRNGILTLISRIGEKKKKSLQFLLQTLNNQNLSVFACIMLARFQTYSFINDEDQSSTVTYLFGSELNRVSRFDEDASGNLVRALSDSMCLRVIIFQELVDFFRPSRYDVVRLSHGSEYAQGLQILKSSGSVYLFIQPTVVSTLPNTPNNTSRMKNINSFDSLKQNKQNKTARNEHENSYGLLAPYGKAVRSHLNSSTTLESGSKIYSTMHIDNQKSSQRVNNLKVCNKCGRQKLEKFCICRKQGGNYRDMSAEKSGILGNLKLCGKCKGPVKNSQETCKSCIEEAFMATRARLGKRNS